MIRTKLTLSLLFFLCIGRAQNLPLYNVPGPEVSGLGLYGQTPVSLFTGVPDISIPLYEVKMGSFSLPIQASYHTASVKPNKTPGPLGLGWSLQIGGYITRTVRGIYDEKKGSSGEEWGFYAHASKMKNITNSQFEIYTRDSIQAESGAFELTADEFSFNFCGHTGNFYYNENNGWTVVSDEDIKVEFNPVIGFATLNQLKDRLSYNHWTQENKNQRFFIMFTLITPDGTRYEFGGINATEFSIPYYARNSSDMIATSWRLTKITTPEKRIITLDYDSSLRVCDLQYIPQEILLYNFASSMNTDPNRVSHINRKGYTGFYLFPTNISRITTPNETIEFTYQRDWDYSMQYNVDAVYWKQPNNIREFFFRKNGRYSNDPVNQFFVFMGNVGSDDENTARETILNFLNNTYLHRIAIHNNDSSYSRSIYFGYQKQNRRKLSLITERAGIPALERDTVISPHDSWETSDYIIPDKPDTVNVSEYRFLYNNETMPYNYVVSATDAWGYYKGGYIVPSREPTYLSIEDPVPEMTKAEILREIIYPTGGRTQFEFKQNRFSKAVGEDYISVVDQIGYSGGLRISKITNIDSDSTIVNVKKYYYSEERTENADDLMACSSGVSRGIPPTVKYYIIPGAGVDEDDIIYEQKSMGGYYTPVTNLNSPDVGYSCVIEETKDSDDNLLGFVKYRYSNYDTDVFGNAHHNESPLYSYNITNSQNMYPYTSTSFERGKLLSKTYYDSHEDSVRAEIFHYKRTAHPPFKTAYQEMIVLRSDNLGSADLRFGWMAYTHTASYLPDSVLTINYDPSNGTESRSMRQYTYNSHKMLSGESYSMSNGSTGTITYRYPYDDSSYAWMTNAHITAPLIGKTETAGGLTRTESTTYARVESGAPYIQKKTLCLNNGLNPKTLFSVSHADKYGNPVEITENSKTSVLLWGGYGQCLVARIENAGFMHCKYRLGLDPNAYSDKPVNELDYNRIFSARSRMPGSLFHIYKYNSSLLLESETLPNGMTDYYSYDVFGRLRERYHFNGSSKKLMTGYDYHYYNH